MSTVQTLPVRLAETVNRFGASRVERSGPDTEAHELVLVEQGESSFVAPAYRRRVTRRGRQTLVSVHGRLTWVDSRRVRPLPDDAA